MQWYRGKRFALTSFNRADNHNRYKFYESLRDACRGKDKVFDASIRRDYNYSGCVFNIYTNDDGLLQFVLHHPESGITLIRYTSEQYDEEIAKLDGVPFDIHIKKTVDPKKLFKCYISSTNESGIQNLGEYIENNPDHFQIDKWLLKRMIETGRVWASDYYFYCDDFDVLTMAVMVGGNSIRKIYKTVKKEDQQ